MQYYVLESFFFYGNNAGYNAHLICTENTCTVYCRGSACNNIGSFNCSDGNSSSCNYNIYCYGALKSNTCPNGYVLPEQYKLPNLVDKKFSTIDNSIITCNKSITNATNCDDYQECYGTTLLTTSNGPICCTGYKSCQESTNIISKVDLINNNSNIYNISFRSDGEYSTTHISGTVSSPKGGNMYFTSFYAGRDSTAIENNGEYDIVVTGSFALDGCENITNARNVYCLGYIACQFASISNINNNVFGYGGSSLYSSTITDVLGNIYCDSSCGWASFTNILGNVIGVGDNVFSYSDFDGIGGVVLGYGDWALISTDIVNATTVIAQGYASLARANIEQISRLEVSGEKSLDSATIITNVQVGNTFTAIIKGNNTKSYTVYCSPTNICKIGCNSADVCKFMNLYCWGTCYVACDEDIGISCPNIIFGNWSYWMTQKPTLIPTIPTSLPSPMPSNIPSSIPSNQPSDPSSIPSKIPTSSPSQIPSAVPSNIPSNHPSQRPSNFPSLSPSNIPSNIPSKIPTNDPSVNPSNFPTILPTHDPSKHPTFPPSWIPSNDPTQQTTFKNAFQTTNFNIASNKKNQLSGDFMFIIICIFGGVIILLLICLLFACFYVKNAKDSKNEMKEVVDNIQQKQAQLELNKIKSVSNDNNNIGNDTEVKLEMTGNPDIVESIFMSEKFETNGKHISSNENIGNQVSAGETEDEGDNPDDIEYDEGEGETQGQFTPQK